MQILDTIFKFVTDARNRITARIFLVFFIILCIFVADNIFGLSYYYTTNRKIEQLKDITSLLKDPSLDSASIKSLLRIRQSTLNRKNFFDRSLAYFVTDKEKAEKAKPQPVDSSQEIRAVKSRFWHFVTTNIVLLLLIIAVPFAPFSQNNKDDRIKAFGNVFLVECIFIVLLFFMSWLFGLIPIIANNPLYNYILNAALNVFLMVWLYFIGRDRS